MADRPIEVEFWRTRYRADILTHARVYLTDAAHLTSGNYVDADAVREVDAPRTRMRLTLCFVSLILGYCKLFLGAAAGA